MSLRFTARTLVFHDEELNLLFCRMCSYAINPGVPTIERHFYRNHKAVTEAERATLRPVFAGVTTMDSTGTNKSATAAEKADVYAIEDRGYCPHLLPPKPGFRCTVTPDCRHCTTTKASLKKHQSEDHNKEAANHREIEVQSLFRGHGLQYFEVQSPRRARPAPRSERDDEEAVMARYREACAAYQRRLHVVAVQNRAQPNMFEDRMAWAILLEGQDLDLLGRQSSPERLEDHDDDGDMEEIWRAARAMVQSCQAALAGTSHFIRRYLYSVNDRISETPLKPVRTAGTVDDYGKHWAHFVVFACRVFRWAPELRVRSRIVLAPALMAALDGIHAICVARRHDEPADRAQPLQDAIFAFSTCVLGQHVGARQNESPLLYFLAVEGWNRTGRRWKSPPEYSGILSAMVYVLRIVAAKELGLRLESERPSVDDEFDLIRTYHGQRLVSGCGGIFDEIFNRRSFTMEVAKGWYGAPKVMWSLTQDSLSFEGETIRIEGMRSMLDGLLHAAEAWICKLLEVDLDYLAMYNPAKVHDDLVWANSGGSLLDLNPSLQNGEDRMNRRGEVVNAYWARIWTRQDSDREIILRQYVADLHQGDLITAQLYMLCGGGPPRAGDMLNAQWTNGQSFMRNFYVVFNRLVLLTMYNKAEVMANAPRVVVRFYPSRLARISLAMVAEALPFLTYLQSAAGQPAPDMDAKMWTRSESTLDSTSISRALQKTTKQYLGAELGIRPLRQILIAIDRELVRQPLLEAKDESVRGAYEAQTGHSEATEEHHYGIQLADLSRTNRQTLLAFLGASTRSHELYHINDEDGVTPVAEDAGTVVMAPKGATKGVSDQLQCISMIIQTVAHQVDHLTRLSIIGAATVKKEQSPTVSSSDTVVSAGVNAPIDVGEMDTLLRRLYGPAAEFRLGQQEACRKMLSSRRDLFVQLPTGGGKTLLVEIAALHRVDKVNIMFVPYDALRTDVRSRLRKVGIDARVFTDELMGHVSVVLLTPEKADQEAFRFYWHRLLSAGMIGRVFWDECHLIEMEATKRSGEVYRPYQSVLDFCAKPALNGAAAPQRVFLSATLPDEIKRAVQQRSKSFDADTVRVSTSRPSIRWEVQRRPSRLMEDALEQLVAEAAPEKVIVYVMSLAAGKRLQARCGWAFYHGGLGDEGAKVMEDFNGGDDRVIIATTAAGSGWDADAGLVVLYGGAFDAVTAAQQGGRAARAVDQRGRCVVLTEDPSSLLRRAGPGIIAWNTFLATQGCRRVALETYLDDCWRPPCHGGEEKCDNCTVTAINGVDVNVVSAPNTTTTAVKWAFQNTIASSSDASDARATRDRIQGQGSPVARVRKLPVVPDSEDEVPSPKRIKRVDTGELVSLVPETTLATSPSRVVSFSDSFDMISSSSSLGDLFSHIPGFEPMSPPQTTMLPKPHAQAQTLPVAQSPALTLRQAWENAVQKYGGNTTPKRKRIGDALTWIVTNRVLCVHCWVYRRGRWDDHTYNSCAAQKAMNPDIRWGYLDRFNIGMKRHYNNPRTIEVASRLHLNCWAPLESHGGRFNWSTTCAWAGIMLAVAETALRDTSIGAEFTRIFRIRPSDDEQRRAERWISQSPMSQDSIMLWDAFLLLVEIGRRE